MQKNSIGFSLVLLLILFSCESTKDLTKFNIPYETEFTIPSSTGINLPIDLYTPEIKTNSEQEFDNNDTRADLVDEVTLNSLKLSIISPEGKTFSFLNNVYIYVKAPGIDEERIAYKENIPSDIGNELHLETEDKDLQKYVKTDSYTLRVEAVTDEVISRDIDIKSNILFRVKAKLL